MDNSVSAGRSPDGSQPDRNEAVREATDHVRRAREDLERARREEGEALEQLERAERDLERAVEASAPTVYIFFIGSHEYHTDQPRLTGAQIKAKVSDWPANYGLSLEGEGDAPDRLIRDDEEVSFEGDCEPRRFIQVPPATFG
jgi:hypothetical protein